MPSRTFVNRYLFPTLTFLALLALWHGVTTLFQIRPLFLPSPLLVGESLLQNSGTLLRHSLVTFNETVMSFILAILVGIPLAIGITYSIFLQNTIYPLLVGAQSIPKVAIAPLLLIWIGHGLGSKVLVAFSIAFFPVVVSTAAGLNAVEPEMMDLIHSLSASPIQIFRLVRLPTAIPFIFAGLKVSVALAVVGALVGEFVGANEGLGYMIILASSELNTALSVACMILLSIIGMGLFLVVVLLEHFLFPWYKAGKDYLL